jgi:oligoribonuclease (3'-5' exoribonuclease)
MFKYNTICLRDNVLCYKKINVLTEEELQNHLAFCNVRTLKELLDRWNQQVESKITKLKWIYYE